MSLPYFPMYPSDFEAKTSHLTIAEDGAYNRLLRVCWMTPGCTLPADEDWIMRRVRAYTEDDKAVVRSVLSEFFEVKNGRYSNAKLMRIWLASSEAHQKRKAAGSKGGSAKSAQSKEKTSSNARAMPKQPEPEPEPEYNPPFSPPLQGEPSAPEKTKPSGKKSDHGSRLPDDWAPSDAEHEFARNEGLTDDDIKREADRFRDYWLAVPGQRGRKRDWAATWRNWIRRSDTGGNGKVGGRDTGSRRPSPHRPKSTSIYDTCFGDTDPLGLLGNNSR